MENKYELIHRIVLKRSGFLGKEVAAILLVCSYA